MAKALIKKPGLSLYVVGMTLSLVMVVYFIVCVVWDLVFPQYAMYTAWAIYYPGFEWITWPSFFLGVVESLIYGWLTAVIFVPIYNYFSRQHA
ncbi:MAG: DUF5676 family membrane protein [Sphingomonadales bacterium]